MFSSHGGFISSQRNNLIKLTQNNETKTMAYDPQIVRAKETVKLSQGGASQNQRQSPNHRLKLYVRAAIEWEA